jgi:hypothetical protein
MMDPEKNITLLTESVRRQREIAQEALEQAKGIDAILPEIKDPEVRKKLEKAKEGILQVAHGLAVNATSTSTSVVSTLDLISNLAKK